MKSWDDFQVGKSYYLSGWSDIRGTICVGKSTKGLPVFERCGVFYLPSGWARGNSPENWFEYREPREFWIALVNSDRVTFLNKGFAEDYVKNWGGEVIHVREVIE